MRALFYNLIPPACLLCRQPSTGTFNLCQGCLKELPFIDQNICQTCSTALPAPGICGKCLSKPPPWTHVNAILHYRFPVPHLIQKFKYHHDTVAGQLLAELFAIRAAKFIQPDVLLAVPLSFGKLRKRGFNQATELTRFISQQLKVPVLRNGVYRQQNNELIQSTLKSRRARENNVNGVFHVKQHYPDQIMSKHIVIIDDVMTSGATVSELSRMLLKRGAKQVDIWVLARA
jgi:ComF family protein